MKKGLISSYYAGITDTSSGESYFHIIRYFVPEYITSFIIFALPGLIDAAFIAHLKSTPTYAALGVTNNFLHLIFKVAEAFSVAAVVLVGYHNGRAEYKQAGKVLRDTFWVTVIAGAMVGITVYVAAYWLYAWLGAPDDIILHGIPYLRIRAVSFIFMFASLSFLGFLRGIKNTRTTMYVYLMGALIFVGLDYCLIFGACGLPAMGLNGSALASAIQHVVMVFAAGGFIFLDRRYRQYGIELFSSFKQKGYVKELLIMVWPVAIDKTMLAIAYLWLNKMINPMGTCTVATFCAVKDMEHIAFLPAIACAQVITFLVSNDYGTHQWHRIKSNIKKVLFLSSLMVGSILVIFSLFTPWVMRFFDKCGDFTPMTVKIFPLLSIFVFFDILQIILSGALRGSGNVRVVMWVRLLIICFYFIPVSYVISGLPISDPAIKFLCIYGSFYIGNALMSVIYIRRFRNDQWKHQLNNK